jgi:hypothetical protein
MNKLEYSRNEFFNDLREKQITEKNIKFNLYKGLGILKEEKIEKNYNELVKEEIERIKNKQKIYDQIKEDKEKEINKEEEYSIRLINFWKRFFIFYGFCFIFILYKKRQKIKDDEIQEKKKIEEKEIKRFSNMIYIDKYKV